MNRSMASPFRQERPSFRISQSFIGMVCPCLPIMLHGTTESPCSSRSSLRRLPVGYCRRPEQRIDWNGKARRGQCNLLARTGDPCVDAILVASVVHDEPHVGVRIDEKIVLNGCD